MSVLLVRYANSFVSLAVAGLVSLACGSRLLVEARPFVLKAARTLAAATLAGLLAVLTLSSNIDLSTRRMQWSPLEVVRSVETRYGNILVTERGETFDFFRTGSLSHTVPDPLYAEESAHIPMLYHPAPRRVLVIGGAGSGIIREVTKHPTVQIVDFVELDPAVISLTNDYAPRGWLEGRGDVAVTPIYGDGRKYVATCDRRYDILIVSVGLPITLQTSRYYTVQFLGQAERVLERDGIIAFKVPSGGAYISPEMGLLLSSLRTTCGQVFDNVILVPGPYIHILASPSLPLGGLTDSLPAVLRERAIGTSFVDEYHLFDRLAPLRRSQIDSVTAMYRTGMVNTDTRPISASYAIARWAGHFESGKLLAALVRRVTVGRFLMGLAASAVVAVFLLMRMTGSPRRALPGSLVLYSVGLTSMFTQVLIIVGFQIVNGYLYGWIAALIGSFMLGMGLASSTAASKGLVGRPNHLPLAAGGLALLPLATLLILRLADADVSLGPLPVSDVVFTGLAFGAGLLGGSVFAIGSTLLAGLGLDAAAGGTLAYSLDLCGATVAGFSTAFLAIPSLGFAASAYAVAMFNAIVLVAIVMGRLVERRGREK
jgi:spermidine synthase